MKTVLKKITLSLITISVMSSSTNALSILGTDISGATLPMQITQNAQLILTAKQTLDQLIASTGIKDSIKAIQELVQLAKFAKEYSIDLMDLTNDIIDNPKSQLGAAAKKLFEDYNLFDDCSYDYMNTDEQRICKSRMVRQVQEIATFQMYNDEVKTIVDEIMSLDSKMKSSSDIKESTDIGNAIQVKLAHLQATKTQVELMIAQNKAKEKIDQRQKEQMKKEKQFKSIEWGNSL